MSNTDSKTLSLIICSRNDDYMGDPMWRLATSINYVSEQIFNLEREAEVEIVVCDWGSMVPISNVIQLTQKSASITSFIEVPLELASELQKDSPFGEVYALNVAARRSKGLYIGRIDQDTLVTVGFLENFFHAFEKRKDFGFDLETSYMFAARKQLPYAFVSKEPSLVSLDKCIENFRSWIFNEELKFCHWASPVGILMMHRDIWDDIGGYDERLIYYWFMDVDLATRLMKKYPIVNIGEKFGYHFYHLEHMPKGNLFRHSHRKLNPDWSKSFDKPVLNPNGKDWGLRGHDLTVSKHSLIPIEVDSNNAATNTNNVALFLHILKGSLRRWTWYQIKHFWYITKLIRKKPYL
ncbi:MAG: hypothetical protein HWE07_11690 [Cytophagia bacterium]|nr:hypothetical protein [Cytophagia bacterium]